MLFFFIENELQSSVIVKNPNLNSFLYFIKTLIDVEKSAVWGYP